MPDIQAKPTWARTPRLRLRPLDSPIVRTAVRRAGKGIAPTQALLNYLFREFFQ